MTSLPAVPTDNLYKFMAFAGLVIFSLSMALPYLKIADIERANIDIDGEIALLEMEQKWMNQDSDEFKKSLEEKRTAIKKSIDEVNAKESSAISEVDQIQKKLDALIAVTDSGWSGFIARGRDGVRKSLAIEVKQNQKNQQLKEARIYLDWMRLGAGIGAVLSFLGFYFWYFRSQKFIDAELRHRANPLVLPVRRLLKSKSG